MGEQRACFGQVSRPREPACMGCFTCEDYSNYKCFEGSLGRVAEPEPFCALHGDYEPCGGEVKYGVLHMASGPCEPAHVCENHIGVLITADPVNRSFEHLTPPGKVGGEFANWPVKVTVITAPPPPRLITYCEKAPPREVVESLIVRCGDGLVGGEPVMGPALWTRQLRLEWERHEKWAVANVHGSLWHSEMEEDAPWMSRDRYGGYIAHGQGKARCRLCGGWIRTLSLPAKP